MKLDAPDYAPEEAIANDCPSEGLTTEHAAEQRAKHGSNEVNVRTEPEWKKIAKRYLDWVSIVIVRFPSTRITCCLSLAASRDGIRPAW